MPPDENGLAPGGAGAPRRPTPAPASTVLHTAASTLALPRQERFAAWREAMGPVIDVQAFGAADDFPGRLQAFAVPHQPGSADHLVLSECISDAVVLERGAARIAQDGLGHFVFQIFTAGGQGEQRLRGGEAHTAAGGILALDMRQPFRIRRGGYHALGLFVPRAVIERHTRYPEDLHGRTAAAQWPMVGLARGYLAQLAKTAPHLEAAELQAGLSAALALVLGCFGCAADGAMGAGSARSSVLMARARYCVEAHLLEPTLDAEFLSRRLAVSRSVLYRLFEPYGGVAAYVRTQRLRGALARLQGSETPVTQIAHDHGFGSASDFARAFRRHYGVPPSDLRAPRGRSATAAEFPYASVMRPAARAAASPR